MNASTLQRAHPDHPKWLHFLSAMQTLMATPQEEAALLAKVDTALRVLIAKDDWLDPAWRRAGADTYRQYPLYIDPKDNFSVVSFVWGPGQTTPIHNHTTWGVVGVLTGAEWCSEYDPPVLGMPMAATRSHLLEAGETDHVSPAVGDIHLVSNAKLGETSISIHVYGKNIGAAARSMYNPSNGTVGQFVSGYSAV
jgi:3-mercaptopropionate dioxygenase